MKKPKYRAYSFYCCEKCKKRYPLKKMVPKEGCCKDSLHWDSEKEYNRWNELKLLRKAGKITALERQVKYVLIPEIYFEIEEDGQEVYNFHGLGDLIQKEYFYVLDFRYMKKVPYESNEITMYHEDTKGYLTKEYKKKKKLMKKIYGIDIKET